MASQHARRPSPARYFPVEATPLRMRPRLRPFGSDLGNGEVDTRIFQQDSSEDHYLREKRPARYRVACGAAAEDDAHRAVLGWIDTRLGVERPDLARSVTGSFAERYRVISDAVQEDFVVLLRDRDRSDRAIAVYVSFPSGWRPEQILGWSFQRIHGPVPEFADTEAGSRSLVSAMIERGAYLRFVWTVCADDALDHHPDEGRRTRFEAGTREGWLRVERQVSVPFPEPQASLFVIRTYLRAFGTLDESERATLAGALRCMPASVANYKGLTGGLRHAIAILEETRERQ